MTMKEFILDLFSGEKDETVSIQRLYKKAIERGYEGTIATFRVWVHLLKKEGLLQRVKTGIYKRNAEKVVYKVPVDYFMKQIALFLRKKYNGIMYDIWNVSLLNEFMRYTFNRSFYILDVEPDIKDFVFEYLQEKSINVFMDISKDEVYRYVLPSKKNTVVLFSLVSESPLEKIDDIYVPRLEKIMVDIIANNVFDVIVDDTENVYKNICDKYIVNEKKLFRYARRRGKEEEVMRMLKKEVGCDIQ